MAIVTLTDLRANSAPWTHPKLSILRWSADRLRLQNPRIPLNVTMPPGPLQYTFSTHYLAHRSDATSPHCAIETAEGAGDDRVYLTGLHEDAERQRQLSRSVGASIRLLRWVDDRAQEVMRWLDRLIE